MNFVTVSATFAETQLSDTNIFKLSLLCRNSISQQYENIVGPEATEDEEEAKYLAKRKMLEEVLRTMKRYSAVERRMKDEYRITIEGLEIQISTLKDQIRRLKENGRGAGNGRSGGSKGRGGRFK